MAEPRVSRNALTVTLRLDGERIEVPAGSTVAAVLAARTAPRRADGAAFLAWCGMGICHGCRVTIDGQPGRRACLVPCADGMEVDNSVDNHEA